MSFFFFNPDKVSITYAINVIYHMVEVAARTPEQRNQVELCAFVAVGIQGSFAL